MGLCYQIKLQSDPGRMTATRYDWNTRKATVSDLPPGEEESQQDGLETQVELELLQISYRH